MGMQKRVWFQLLCLQSSGEIPSHFQSTIFCWRWQRQPPWGWRGNTVYSYNLPLLPKVSDHCRKWDRRKCPSEHPAPSLLFFQPRARREGGDERILLRHMLHVNYKLITCNCWTPECWELVVKTVVNQSAKGTNCYEMCRGDTWWLLTFLLKQQNEGVSGIPAP